MCLCAVMELGVQSGVATKETKAKVDLTLFFVGLTFGKGVATCNALDGSSFKAATTGFQSSPSRVLVIGLDRSRVKLPSKPVSHDWCPEKTSGTMEEALQVPNHC